MVTQSTTVEEFIEKVCEKLDMITSHSYIVKSQAEYLKNLKSEMSQKEVSILCDSAENFKSVVQNEVHGCHWNQQRCTVHPAVVYHKCNEKSQLNTTSLCFLLDGLCNDVTMVHKILAESMKYIIENIPCNIKKVQNFSDDCAGQFKNCNHFFNVFYHMEDFSIQRQWNVLATSHVSLHVMT